MIEGPQGNGAARAAAWRRADAAWERLQESGNKHLAEGAKAEATWAFRRAGWIARLAFRRADPRRATSLANLALADRLGGREARARRRYARARALWAGVEGYIATMEIARRSRSARLDRAMEPRHLETFRQNMRVRMTGIARATGATLEALEAGRPVRARLAARWEAERPPVFDDTRRLMAAALLVAVPLAESGDVSGR